jgi:hypothetical protein
MHLAANLARIKGVPSSMLRWRQERSADTGVCRQRRSSCIGNSAPRVPSTHTAMQQKSSPAP